MGQPNSAPPFFWLKVGVVENLVTHLVLALNAHVENVTLVEFAIEQETLNL